MSTYDVRDEKDVIITRIAFAPEEYEFIHTLSIDGKRLCFEHGEDECMTFDRVFLEVKDVDNLLKAIQKAKELGWLNVPEKASSKKGKKK